MEKSTSLLRLVKERALLKKKAEEELEKAKQVLAVVPYLSNDCINKILLLLPLESLPRCRFVCKTWYHLINDRVFINDHFNSSESVLIFLQYPSSRSIIPPHPNTFSVESTILGSTTSSIFAHQNINKAPKFLIKFMKFKDGKMEIGEYSISCLGGIRAACNGLILIDSRTTQGGLIIMNPVTRKLTELPLGTLWDQDKESYAFAQCDKTGDCKVVHLFRERYGNVSCEILNLKDRSWRPSFGPSIQTFSYFGYQPVVASGGFHWIPQADESEHVVSMEIASEKFHILPLPKSCGKFDRILEIKSCLCFLSHEDFTIQIWSLNGLCCSNRTWTMQHVITSGSIIDMVPLISFRQRGELIFMRKENWSFFAYDFDTLVMTEIDNEEHRLPLSGSERPARGVYIPHVNTLKTWD